MVYMWCWRVWVIMTCASQEICSFVTAFCVVIVIVMSIFIIWNRACPINSVWPEKCCLTFASHHHHQHHPHNHRHYHQEVASSMTIHHPCVIVNIIIIVMLEKMYLGRICWEMLWLGKIPHFAANWLPVTAPSRTIISTLFFGWMDGWMNKESPKNGFIWDKRSKCGGVGCYGIKLL